MHAFNVDKVDKSADHKYGDMNQEKKRKMNIPTTEPKVHGQYKIGNTKEEGYKSNSRREGESGCTERMGIFCPSHSICCVLLKLVYSSN